VAVIGAAALLLAPSHLTGTSHRDWLLFAVLTACAAPIQLLSVETPVHEWYSPALVFFVAGALLLPPQLVALMIVLAHVPDWVRGRSAWYVQVFNIAAWTCAALIASLVCGLFVDRSDPGQHITLLALGGAIAAAACVLVDDVLLAQMLRIARGTTFRESGLFAFGNLSTELGLAALGVGLAAVWELAPAIVPFLLAPLVVAYRALRLPSMELAARLDPKTDLFNARYFGSALEAEIERARRFERPLSILLADLDLLRSVNNTYGHLAGDAVLRGVAAVLRTQLRPFDIPCRFGGEEFAVVLPEAGHDDALAIAERVRREVAATPFRIPTGDGEIRATVSIGVATHPEFETADDLVHQADLALYRAKALGRNRVSGQVEVVASKPYHADRAAIAEPAGPAGPVRPWVDVFSFAVLAVALAVGLTLVLARGTLTHIVAFVDDSAWQLGLATVALPLLVGVWMSRSLARTRAAEEQARAQAEELDRRKQLAQRTYLETLAALSRSMQRNNGNGRPDWVRRLSVELARTLGYRQEDLEAIEIGALLHDIGKARVPERIVNKPGPLTEDEWEEMRTHPVASDSMLSGIELHPIVRQIARSTHERIDGKGYPDGLAGDEIPLPARIVLVADAFDALARDRPHRSARPVSEALEELRANAGTQFCPTVLAALESLLRDQPERLQGAPEPQPAPSA
jgi:diguanylate cyclase (GGDEF)-like protein/putative nucleotidyltransferase with HDIG domain